MGPASQIVAEVPATKIAAFAGRMVMIGMGMVGTASLPLILKHIDMAATQVTVITGHDRAAMAAQMALEYPGITIDLAYLVETNYEAYLSKYLGEGDMVVNLSVDVSSCAVMEWCGQHGVIYVDTVVEPWGGLYTDPTLTPAERSNYALREKSLALKKKLGPTAPTAISCHGANPGMVSLMTKQALLNLADDRLPAGAPRTPVPTTRAGWAALSQAVGVKIIHIAERDTQVQDTPKLVGQFVNTWSVEGFIGEGRQPAEMGWGSHEKELPHKGARHSTGCGAAIYVKKPGASMRVRTWTPTGGPFHGFLVTHNEAISIADYLTVGDGEYRPTVHYAYHPCGDALVSLHEMAGNGWVAQTNHKIIVDEVTSGMDELGVLMMGTAPGTQEHFTYWYGSQMEVHQAKRLAPHNSATSLQISSAVLAATAWAICNPRRGILEAEDLPHTDILNVQSPYIAPVVGVYTPWTPLHGRNVLFEEDVDLSDPFQFKNVLVD